VIVFIQRTWFIWWILATVFILRWFHLFSHRTTVSALELPDLDQEETTHHQIPPEQQAVYLSKTENLVLRRESCGSAISRYAS
jgi:hypothetical protein